MSATAQTEDRVEDESYLSADELIEKYLKILAETFPTNVKEKEKQKEASRRENALTKLCEIYRDRRDTQALADLIRNSRETIFKYTKNKTGKLLMNLFDIFASIPNCYAQQIQVCKETFEWAVSESRVFLRQALQTRLVNLYLENKNYQQALALISSLLIELKRLDDNSALMKVQLLESRVHHALKNIPKSKAALIAARTSANSIYCPPLMQAELDMQSGILHAEEKDYKTAHSYFYETLDAFSSQDDPRAMLALKYLLMCMTMLNMSSEVNAIISGKLASKYAGVHVDAIRAVEEAHRDRSLKKFEEALVKYKDELTNDPVVKSHLSELYDMLFEQNLLRMIEPYSRVEISHISNMVKLPTKVVEQKLSQMILDKVLNGILDQNAGCLEIFEPIESNSAHEAALGTIKNMSTVVESLYKKKFLTSRIINILYQKAAKIV